MSLTHALDSTHVPDCFVTPESPAAEAARLIARRRIGAVPVQDRAGRLVGLVSEHDIVRVVASRALGLRGLAVEEVMDREPATVCPETSPEMAMELMQRRDLRHLPVCGADGQLLGLVGLADLIRRE
ncbi:CBS domain-containing protein [Falsiroseomonas oryzae]|uniref:CBS domain-containing protein n=1 Tax=Falsiroseomonas oryzae TaxID=2766473 RepID=UPI0022EAC4C4|nr:CBS domain-containing protein [Roseomonas sp. MO-31]